MDAIGILLKEGILGMMMILMMIFIFIFYIIKFWILIESNLIKYIDISNT